MRIPSLLFAGLAAALGTICIHLYGQVKSGREHADLEARRIETLEAEVNLLRHDRKMQAAGSVPSQDVTPSRPSATATVTVTPAGTPAIEGADQSNPEVRRRMREEAVANMRNLQGELIKELGLSPEQTRQLIEVLVDQQMKLGEMLDGSLDSQKIRAVGEQVQREADARLIGVLGNKYLQYDKYRRSESDRLVVGNLTRQLSAVEIPLQEDQRKRLLLAFEQERDRIPSPAASGAALAPDSTAALEWTIDYQKRLAERAAQVLTPEQYRRYERDMQHHMDWLEDELNRRKKGRGR